MRRSWARPARSCRCQRTVEDAAAQDILGRARVVEEPAEPHQRLEIPEPALALLDIGLEQVTAVAHALVPLVALGEDALDEGGLAARHDLVVETLAEPLQKRP